MGFRLVPKSVPLNQDIEILFAPYDEATFLVSRSQSFFVLSVCELRAIWQTVSVNGVMAVILRYSTEFGSFERRYVKVVEDRPLLSPTKKFSPKTLVLAIYDLLRNSQKLPRKSALTIGTPCQKR